MNDEPLLNPQDVGNMLRTPVSSVYRWQSQGGGPPFYKLNQRVRYKRSEVLEWLETKKKAGLHTSPDVKDNNENLSDKSTDDKL